MSMTTLTKELLQAVKQHAKKRCETCTFWKGKPGWFNPKHWKTCELHKQAKSPVDSCGQWVAKAKNGNGGY